MYPVIGSNQWGILPYNRPSGHFKIVKCPEFSAWGKGEGGGGRGSDHHALGMKLNLRGAIKMGPWDIIG